MKDAAAKFNTLYCKLVLQRSCPLQLLFLDAKTFRSLDYFSVLCSVLLEFLWKFSNTEYLISSKRLVIVALQSNLINVKNAFNFKISDLLIFRCSNSKLLRYSRKFVFNGFALLNLFVQIFSNHETLIRAIISYVLFETEMINNTENWLLCTWVI